MSNIVVMMKAIGFHLLKVSLIYLDKAILFVRRPND